MHNHRKLRAFFFYLIGLLLSGCETAPQAQQSKKLVQAIEGTEASTLTVVPLLGGRSKASLFLVSSEAKDKKYVVRFFPHESKQNRERIIQIQTIASQLGYGPHVFHADADAATIVMDYLAQESGDKKDHTPEKLATLLKSIHNGPAFPVSWTLWDRAEENLRVVENIKQNLVSIDAVRHLLRKLVQDLSPHLKAVPCHRDLNPANVIISSGRYWAIDYDNASNDDPILDLAITGLVHAYTQAENQKLLQAYFGRPAQRAELEKFHLCRNIAILFYATEALAKLPQAVWSGKVGHTPPLKDVLAQMRSGQFSLDLPQNQLILALCALKSVFNNE